MTADASESRRDFLKTGTRLALYASGILGAGGLLRYLSYAVDGEAPSQIGVGTVADFPPGTRTVIAAVPALLIHDDDGLRAVSLTCPHLGCTVEDLPSGLTCPCHGSRFDADGTVTRGPAVSSLKPLGVEIGEGDTVTIVLNG